MWKAYEDLQAPLVGGVLQRGREAFARQHRFQQCSNDLRKLSRKARKDWLVSMLQAAEQAAAKHNLSEVYSVINRIAPRSRSEPVRIRSASGTLQTKQQEYNEIYQYFSHAFGSSVVEPVRCSCTSLQPTQEEVESAVASLKGGKAVPKTIVCRLMFGSYSGYSAALDESALPPMSFRPASITDFSFRRSWQTASCLYCQSQARFHAGHRILGH